VAPTLERLAPHVLERLLSERAGMNDDLPRAVTGAMSPLE